MNKLFYYRETIREHHLDTFGHVNNATYLGLLESARWELMYECGYDHDRVEELQIGPIVLEIKVRFKKELRLRQKIIIETHYGNYKRKITNIYQKIKDDEGTVYTEAHVVGALFDMQKRKLIKPTPEWLQAIGVVTSC